MKLGGKHKATSSSPIAVNYFFAYEFTKLSFLPKSVRESDTGLKSLLTLTSVKKLTDPGDLFN